MGYWGGTDYKETIFSTDCVNLLHDLDTPRVDYKKTSEGYLELDLSGLPNGYYSFAAMPDRKYYSIKIER